MHSTDKDYRFKPHAELLEQYARTPQGKLMEFPQVGPLPLKEIQKAMIAATGLAGLLSLVALVTGSLIILFLAFILIASAQSMYWPLWIGTSQFVAKEKQNYYGF